jgi:UDP-glucose 4-epimerase
MRILITGGSGFIGSHLAEYFQNKAQVRILDNLRTGHRENLKGLDVEFIEASILDRDAVNKAVQDVDYIFHLAAMISVAESMSKPIECVDLNVRGLLNVLEEASEANVTKLCLSSSAAIYGNNPSVPKLETMLPEPASPYAITKLDGEYYCDLFQKTGRLNTACLRFFNVFGPRQDPKSAYAAAVPIFIDKALRNEPITIYGDGEQTRDFVFVKDIAAANAFLADKPELSGVYNVGYGQQISINDLAHLVLKMTESTSEIQHQPVRSGDVKHSLASAEKLFNTGFNPNYDFESGLRETLDSFQDLRSP